MSSNTSAVLLSFIASANAKPADCLIFKEGMQEIVAITLGNLGMGDLAYRAQKIDVKSKTVSMDARICTVLLKLCITV